MQDGDPNAYALRALTPTETYYAQIEKELLSVVFARSGEVLRVPLWSSFCG